MLWLSDCRTRVVKFLFSNESVVEWKGGNSIRRGQLMSYLKVIHHPQCHNCASTTIKFFKFGNNSEIGIGLVKEPREHSFYILRQ